MWRYPFGPHVISTSSNHSLLTAGDQLVVPVGVTHISLPLHQLQSGNRRKRTNEQTLGVNSSAEGELCNTLCMCRLTLVWILAKLPQSNWNADSIFLHWSGPNLLPTGLSAPVSGVDCLVRGPAPTAHFELLCSTNSLFASPSTSGHGEISSPKPFFWFRAKTDKGIVCLAGHLHSVTARKG